MLKIENLCAKVTDGEAILKSLNLNIKAGEVHAIMGPNGSGKSTLSKVIAGHPDYEITAGSIEYEGRKETLDITELEPYERAREGVFLAFQYPVEIPGVNNATFLRAAYNEIQKYQEKETADPIDFIEILKAKMKLLAMDEKFIGREVNVDFSGGEKKRNEILQMAVLEPRLAILDETDSGLDIDSLRIVADGVNKLKSADNAILVITHYQRLLEYIVPDFVHILIDGQIVESGGKELALKVEDKGYDWLDKAKV